MSAAPVEAQPDAARSGPAKAGLAHVATVSFLATRATPVGNFWVALAGGIALARESAVNGLRAGFGASIASMLQTVAIMGPARFNGPLTFVFSAPLTGWMEARGRSMAGQVLVTTLIRWLHYTATNAFWIWVVVGLPAFVGTYNRLFGWILPEGTTAALVATVITDFLWAVLFSTIQVMVLRRGLRRWPDVPPEEHGMAGAARVGSGDRGRYDPRLLALIALVLFVVLLIWTEWVVLAGCALVLLVLALVTRGNRSVWRVGAVLAAILAAIALGIGLFGGIGADEAIRRALRAALLVLVATWLRAAAGADGLHEVGQRVLYRLRFIPAVPEATERFVELDSGPRLVGAAKDLGERLRDVRKRPWPIADALIGWVAAEAVAVSRGRPRQAPVAEPEPTGSATSSSARTG